MSCENEFHARIIHQLLDLFVGITLIIELFDDCSNRLFRRLGICLLLSIMKNANSLPVFR
jgi:hypothetical protein